MTMGDTEQRETTASDLRLTIVETAQDVANRAADIIAETLAANPAAPISLPTGSTPVVLFQEILRRIETGEMDISKMNLFLLDDYLGQSRDDEASLTNWLTKEFLGPAKLGENVHYIPADAEDPEAAIASYEAELAALGGLDLAVLGIGPNGHIAFNEPGSDKDSRTRIIDLTSQSLEQSAAYWNGRAEIPSKAMTMGVANFLEADRIAVIVTGESKAEILRKALEDPMTADVPASWLRLAAGKLEVIADKAAASRLTIA